MTENVSETVPPTAAPAAAPAAQEEVRTVGPRQGLGAGIVGLGILLIALPMAVGSLPTGADPAGAATLTVTYTGYEPASAQLNVSAGATVTRDFDLTPALFAPRSPAAPPAPSPPRRTAPRRRRGGTSPSAWSCRRQGG